MKKLLEVKHLKTCFHLKAGIVAAVDDVSFSISEGKTLGVLGESGCGKTITALSVLRLLPGKQCSVTDGQILFDGEDLLQKNESQMRAVRGGKIGMIFQEPMTSLNPIFTVGSQIAEAVRTHRQVSRAEAKAQTVELLKLVDIPSPERRAREYPHQMSGGMRQRAMIAMAFAGNPRFLIADEPTTALDVTIQAQILELMRDLKERFCMSIMLISHDVGVIADLAERVMVMYAGQVVELGDVVSLLRQPKHPYTQGLLHAIPYLGRNNCRLGTIPGTVPNLLHIKKGCRFYNRCAESRALCEWETPRMHDVEGILVRCWKYSGDIV
jgi:oligopeptide/dipeptide ABC transporter ATP-binding protein